MKKRNLIATLCVAAVLAFGMALAGCAAKPDPAEQIKADIAAQFDPVKTSTKPPSTSSPPNWRPPTSSRPTASTAPHT